MKKLTYIALSSLVFALSSCGDPRDKIYHHATAEEDYKRIVEMDKLDSADQKILSHFMVEHGLAPAHILETEKTYREILEEARRTDSVRHDRESVKKLKNPEDIARKRYEEAALRINKVLGVVSMDASTSGGSDADGDVPGLIRKDRILKGSTKEKGGSGPILTYKVGFFNKGDKPIKAFKGTISFGDRIFLSEIKNVEVINLKELAPGDTMVQTFKLDLSQVNKENQLTLGLTKDMIKYFWYPDKVYYDDKNIIE